MKRLLGILLIGMSLVIGCGGDESQSPPTVIQPPAITTSFATLTWDPNTESDLAGYKIYRANAPDEYGAPIAIVDAPTTTYVSEGDVGTTYYFVITAFDDAGNESDFSNEVPKLF